ncbi:MAG: cellulose synthase, partial [Bacteroidetes bacterium]|nr:cellulose synthase [Bacteroidota bacterium]
VSWVWNPWQANTLRDYYPGDDYVDWIGITCLNYGSASWNGRWHSFESLYNAFRGQLLALNKPVMLAEFGSTPYGGNTGEWLQHALSVLPEQYSEIKSFVFFNSDEDRNWPGAWRPSPAPAVIDWSIPHPWQLHDVVARFGLPQKAAAAHMPAAAAVLPRPAIHTGLIKGIAYNPGQHWRDGREPLTISQLEKDFTALRATGCNTIRRYQPSVYDRNILRVAEKQGLKVVYGFWFDPKVDYYKDSAQADAYLREVMGKIKGYKSNPAILAWCLGDGTEARLSNYFVQPYLQQVRTAYARMLEQIARSVHGIDTLHPVMSAVDDVTALPAALALMHNEAPSLDIIGVNIRRTGTADSLSSLMAAIDPGRPWMLSELGAREYQLPGTGTLLTEESDGRKAAYYAGDWQASMAARQSGSLGGIAFCWKDRYDGSATWYGITDYRGRRKPAYYALQRCWRGQNSLPAIPRL